jgi:hypothetical protein
LGNERGSHGRIPRQSLFGVAVRQGKRTQPDELREAVQREIQRRAAVVPLQASDDLLRTLEPGWDQLVGQLRANWNAATPGASASPRIDCHLLTSLTETNLASSCECAVGTIVGQRSIDACQTRVHKKCVEVYETTPEDKCFLLLYAFPVAIHDEQTRAQRTSLR